MPYHASSSFAISRAFDILIRCPGVSRLLSPLVLANAFRLDSLGITTLKSMPVISAARRSRAPTTNSPLPFQVTAVAVKISSLHCRI
jgi:hypothetical protein